MVIAPPALFTVMVMSSVVVSALSLAVRILMLTVLQEECR